MNIKQRNDNLTKQQELELGEKIQAMKAITTRENYDISKLSQDELETVKIGKTSLDILVGNYYDLARKIAHINYKKTGTQYELEDLLQDANSALIESALTYDPSKNCKLSTHAYYAITKRVSSTINYQRPVRLPENKMGEYIKIKNAQKEFQLLPKVKQDLYKNELEYVYAHSGIKEEEVIIILNNMKPQVSLNTMMFDSQNEILDTIVDETSVNDIAKVEKLDPTLEKLLSYLTPLQRDYIAYEFEVIEPSMPFEEFIEKHNITEREFNRETRKVITVLSNIAKKKKLKVVL